MDPNHGREETLFEAARQLTDIEEREAFLDLACGSDQAMRQRIETMVGDLKEADSFFKEGEAAVRTVGASASPPFEKPGDKIGRYKLLEQIGEGGYGIVYLAEQQEPVRRRVALKVLKLGMDTRSALARFEAERQALALMDHPNIARVLDAGATDTGRPYFVMELVRGIRITEYCDQQRIPTQGRLQLFSQVCQAVQHAHQKGIIHRDLKPSNILVTENDGAPTPKIIDFGIAKAIAQPLTDKTLFTAFAQFLGTPTYMSPEQAGMTSVDIDTRADIYSLGVLLYELLTGRTPFTKQALLEKGWDEMRKTICEQAPPRPSTTLGAMTQENLTGLAQRHQTEPARLLHRIRGDLDWIVMKCLEKDRSRRYDTANALFVDIQRHLKNEPVLARPPSKLYEFQKTVRRHKVGFGATAAIMIVLTVAVIVSTIEAFNLNRARLVAKTAELNKSESERQAREEAAKARVAEADAREKLRMSYLSQAQAGRWSRRAGRRFKGLELLKEAARIRPDVDLRNEAIACGALVDLRLINEIPVPSSHGAGFDARYERYVFCDAQGVVHIRRVEDSTELLQLPGYHPNFRGFDFSPDGKLLCLACGQNGERAEIVDLASQAVLIRLNEPGFRCMRFSDDSRFAAIAYEDKEHNHPIRLIDIKAGREIASLEHGSLPYYVSFQPHESRQILTSDQTQVVRLWDFSAKQPVATFTHPNSVIGIAWHPNGRTFATGCEDNRVRIWDPVSGKEAMQMIGHIWNPVGVSFSPGGEFLASVGWDGFVFLWDTYSGQELLRKPVYGQVPGFGSGANRLAIVTARETYSVLEAAAGLGFRMLLTDPGGAGRITSCDFSPDSRWLVSTDERSIQVWDVNQGKVLATLPRPGDIKYAAFHPNGTNLFIGTTAGVEKFVAEETSSSGLSLRAAGMLNVQSRYGRIVLSSDGQTLATGAREGVHFFDLNKNQESRALNPPYSYVFVELSPDGRLAATWNHASTNIQIWDVASATITHEIPAHASIYAAFSSDRRWLAVGDNDEVRVWDISDWHSLYAVPRQDVAYWGFLAFSPDNRILAAAISRTNVRLIETATGHELATLEAPEARSINGVTFDSTGTRLAVVCGHIQLWDLRAIREELASIGLDWEMPPYALTQRASK